MRILKEYSALTDKTADYGGGAAIPLIPENREKAADYIEEATFGTGIDVSTLISLKVAASDIFGILAQNAVSGEEARIVCTYHKYYYMLAFEFSESALPLHTLNKSVKMLNPGGLAEPGFMDLVHLVNRIELSVDRVTEKMRLTVIIEKRYSVDEITGELPPVKGGFNISFSENLAKDFSKRLYKQYGKNIDKFLISGGLLSDNIEAGELEAVFISDEDGNAAGGAVWQKTYGIVVLMIFAVFAEQEKDEAKRILFDEFVRRITEAGANFVVAELTHSEDIADYFGSGDEKYRYKSLLKQKKHVSYIKPDLIPLIKKACKHFELDREIRQINYNYSFIEPHSVITAKIDADASEAVLSVMWFGDDLKSNIIRHIIALKKLGIETVYFKLDLGVYEETLISDLVLECGFEAMYLLPFSGRGGDTAVFVYIENSVYEMKPCVIAPINKSNADKTPALVRKVYGDNYPSQYLYDSEKLREKIRKRVIYPFIAIDDEEEAVGLISFIKLASNPYLFEIGQLMVDPVHRGTNVVNQLIEYIYKTAIKSLDFDAVISESVTNHKLSQRSCVNSGFCDCALKIGIMSEEAFSLEENRRRIGRMSCVVSCVERADENFTAYLPEIYADYVKFCFTGLKPRVFENSAQTPDADTITEYRVDDAEATTSLLLNVTLFNIGADIASVAEKLEHFAESRGIKSVLLNIPLNNPCNAAAVAAFKPRGFFFGGVMPYWLPESDALLMQKVYGDLPDRDSIKLFSGKIKKIAEFIKKDILS